MAVATEERVTLVKTCTDERVAVVRDDDGRRHLVLLAAGGVERCSSCARQPCLHVALALETLNEAEERWDS